MSKKYCNYPSEFSARTSLNVCLFDTDNRALYPNLVQNLHSDKVEEHLTIISAWTGKWHQKGPQSVPSTYVVSSSEDLQEEAAFQSFEIHDLFHVQTRLRYRAASLCSPWWTDGVSFRQRQLLQLADEAAGSTSPFSNALPSTVSPGPKSIDHLVRRFNPSQFLHLLQFLREFRAVYNGVSKHTLR